MSETPSGSSAPARSVAAAERCPACGQRPRSQDERRRRRFYWGVALAWLPFLPVVAGLVNAFRSISQQKATGLGAVAGGIAEMGVVFVLTLVPVFAISAIVLLVRSFSKEHPVRSALAVISLCWMGLMLSVLTLFVWLVFVKFPQH
jgi:hypothetical protein